MFQEHFHANYSCRPIFAAVFAFRGAGRLRLRQQIGINAGVVELGVALKPVKFQQRRKYRSGRRSCGPCSRPSPATSSADRDSYGHHNSRDLGSDCEFGNRQ
jgi:hypothetical protein